MNLCGLKHTFRSKFGHNSYLTGGGKYRIRSNGVAHFDTFQIEYLIILHMLFQERRVIKGQTYMDRFIGC